MQQFFRQRSVQHQLETHVSAAIALAVIGLSASAALASDHGYGPHDSGHAAKGRRLFERETFGGNGRTCLTCHSRETGTVSPEDALERFDDDPDDPLFLHDGSDDGAGSGVTRILTDATILVQIPLPANVSLADDPEAFVIPRLTRTGGIHASDARGRARTALARSRHVLRAGMRARKCAASEPCPSSHYPPSGRRDSGR